MPLNVYLELKSFAIENVIKYFCYCCATIYETFLFVFTIISDYKDGDVEGNTYTCDDDFDKVMTVTFKIWFYEWHNKEKRRGRFANY